MRYVPPPDLLRSISLSSTITYNNSYEYASDFWACTCFWFLFIVALYFFVNIPQAFLCEQTQNFLCISRNA